MTTEVKQPGKQQMRELDRWKRILALHEGGLSKDEIAEREGVTSEQVRRLIHKGEEARANGWL